MMMKHFLIFFYAMMALPVIMLAQYTEQSLVVYHSSGTSDFFACETIDSITYSYYDTDNLLCDQVVTLIVHTPDATVPMAIADIDSIQVLSLPSYCPDAHHPHAIDLGLPNGTLWACCNIGAKVPKGYGGYFAWGEIEEKNLYKEDNYSYSYYDSAQGEYVYQHLGKDISGTEYDVALAKWGTPWCMPSKADCEELIQNCQNQPITYRGVSGTLFTGPNGNGLFMPDAGWYSPAYHDQVSQNWTSTPYYTTTDYFGSRAYFLNITPLGSICLVGLIYNDRFLGKTVRAVVKE